MKKLKFSKSKKNPPEPREEVNSKLQNILLENEEGFRELIEQQGEGISIIDPKERVLYCNAVGEEIFGVGPGELTGRGLREFAIAESFEKIRQETKKRYTGIRSTYSVEIIRPDGEHRHLLVTASPRFDKKGKYIGSFGIFRDDTERQKAREALESRLKSEQIIASISSRFVGKTDFDQAIHQSLGDLGSLCHASRAYLFLFSSNGATMNNTHEWCAKGVTPEIDHLKNVPVENFPWWIEKLNQEGIVYVADVSKMPEEAQNEKSALVAQNIKSLVVLPVRTENRLKGFVGFDNIWQKGGWPEEDVTLLKLFAEILSNAFERKQAEEALRESELKYRFLIESSPLGIFSADADGNIQIVNQTLVNILGSPSVEATKKINLLSFPPLREQGVSKIIQHSIRTGKSFIGDFPYRSAWGKEIFCSFYLDPVFNSKHEVIGVQGVVEDITERKRAENIIRERLNFEKTISAISSRFVGTIDLDEAINTSLAELGEISKASRDYLFVFDDAGDTMKNTYEWCAPGVKPQIQKLQNLSVKKYPRLMKRLLDGEIVEIKDVSKIAAAEKEFRKTLTSQNIKSCLFIPVRVGGKTIGFLGYDNVEECGPWSESDIRLLKLFAEILGSALERKQAEDKLKNSIRQNEVLLSAMPDTMFIMNRDGTIRNLKLNQDDQLTVSRDEVQGSNIRDAGFSPEAQQAIFEQIEKALSTGNVQTVDYELKTPGGLQAFEARIAPLNENEVIANVRNITERKKLEEEQLKAEKLNSLGILAGGIAHDFNNLMTAVLGNISLAKMYLDPDHKANERLTAAERASARTKDLTHQLLTFSKGGEPIKKPVHSGRIVKEATQFALRGTNIKYEFFIPKNLWMINADQGQISQVIHNLVLNAVQAMPDGGVVWVRCQNVTLKGNTALPLPVGRYVKISVEDQGTGIAKKHLQRIFDPYFTTKQTGSGLGLATVYSIIKKHAGYITVESELGTGSTFTFYLPALSRKKTANLTPKTTSFTSGGKALIMDDEKVVRETAAKMLTNIGFNAVSVETGEEAIEAYRKQLKKGERFLIVLMDLTIPGGMGGKETIAQLRKIDPEVKAIVSSGYSNDPVMSNYKQYGFCGVIAKPYDQEELSRVIKCVLEKGS